MEAHLPNPGTTEYTRALRNSALVVLEKAKALEAKKMKKGFKYIKSGDKTWKLTSNDNNRPTDNN
jgi:hypothetical protein